ncbi:MAG: heme o synthase [Bacteroidota bacterium]
MQSKTFVENRIETGFKAKAKAYMELMKFRLTGFVAFSAVFGFAMAADGMSSWTQLLIVGLSGLMITGGANALNQLFEKSLDAKMERTKDRPMPQGRLSDNENLIFALLMGIGGVALLGYFFNLPAALLGIIGYLSYAFVYTPMKQMTPFAVFVGAIPGALPPMIGWVAFTGALTSGGWLLFAFQFFWQFPHFWAIAWLMDDDYKLAGFRMLPTSSGRSVRSARLILTYSICLALMAWFPWRMGMVELSGALGLLVIGLLFAYPAWRLFRQPENMKNARYLLFASFFYLPLMQLIFWLS